MSRYFHGGLPAATCILLSGLLLFTLILEKSQSRRSPAPPPQISLAGAGASTFRPSNPAKQGFLRASPTPHGPKAQSAGLATVASYSPPDLAPQPQRQRAQTTFFQSPLSFEANHGQAGSEVKFFARGPGYGLFLTANGALLSLKNHEIRSSTSETNPESAIQNLNSGAPSLLKFQLLNAALHPPIEGLDEQPGKVNYFIGNDPARWRTNVSTFAKVKYEQVYPGIDLVYYGKQRQLEYDFIVAPGADPSLIRMEFEGAHSVEIDANGELVLRTAGGEVRQHRPIIYQVIQGVRREVEGGYVLQSPRSEVRSLKSQVLSSEFQISNAKSQISEWPGQSARNAQIEQLINQNLEFPNSSAPLVTFAIASYDPAHPLIIDPVLSYSTFLGGSDADAGASIAVDAAGNVHVIGWTDSLNFPIANALQSTNRSPFVDNHRNVFVTKLNAAGTGLIYSTYLGGNNNSVGSGIATDDFGNAYITGQTQANDFPTSNNAYLRAFRGNTDVFVAELSPDGSALLFSTFLGGEDWDWGDAIAIDPSGNSYVTGRTVSKSFPVTPGAFQRAFGGGTSWVAGDAFVTKLNAGGSALIYSTYLGGSQEEAGKDIAVDDSENVYLYGSTGSSNSRSPPTLFNGCTAETGTVS